METCTSTSPVSPVTEHLSPVFEALELGHKLGNMSVVDCSKHVHCWSSPCPEDLVHDFRGEADLAEIGGLLSRSDSLECAWP